MMKDLELREVKGIQRRGCWNIKTNATAQKHYLLYNAAAGSLSGLWAIRPCRRRVFCAFTLFAEEINTDRDKEQHFSRAPPGLETLVAWVFEVVVSLWSTHESGFLSASGELSQMGFMHGLDCLPVPGPSWEKLHFSLKKEEVSQAFSMSVRDTALLSRHRPRLTCHASLADRTVRSGIHTPSAAPPHSSAFVSSSLRSLPHYILFSLGPLHCLRNHH